MKRFQNGVRRNLSLCTYGYKGIYQLPFKEEFWTLTAESDEPEQTKPWWKFW